MSHFRLLFGFNYALLLSAVWANLSIHKKPFWTVKSINATSSREHCFVTSQISTISPQSVVTNERARLNRISSLRQAITKNGPYLHKRGGLYPPKAFAIHYFQGSFFAPYWTQSLFMVRKFHFFDRFVKLALRTYWSRKLSSTFMNFSCFCLYPGWLSYVWAIPRIKY